MTKKAREQKSPLLDIIDKSGRMHANAALRTIVTMAMPNQPRSREIFYASAAIVDEDVDTDPMFQAQLELLRKSYRSGYIAGQMLLMMASLKKFTNAPPSLNKVRFLCCELAGELFHMQPQEAKQSLPQSEKPYKQMWAEFRSVSHLWGALSLEVWQKGQGVTDTIFSDPQHFTAFLARAHGLQMFINQDGHSPVPEMHLVPPQLLPDVVSLTIPKFNDSVAALLLKYRAPKAAI